MDNYKRVEKMLYNYKMQVISIINIREEIKLIQEDCGVGAICYDSQPSNTNKINSIVENVTLSATEKIEYLERTINRLQRQIDKVDRTIEGLTEEEQVIIRERYINGLQWYKVAYKVGYSENHSKKKRKEAIKKMVDGIYGEKDDTFMIP